MGFPKGKHNIGTTGDDDGINALLSHAKLFITASEWEKFGRPCQEAQALNIPVVAFDVGRYKEIVGKIGGIVVEAGNKKAFKEAIKREWYKS